MFITIRAGGRMMAVYIIFTRLDFMITMGDGCLKMIIQPKKKPLAQTIINSAKVEVDYIKASGSALQSQFIENNQTDKLPAGITGTTIHRIKG